VVVDRRDALINFRIKPQPQNEFEEMEPESDWIVAMPDDYFLDEMERHSGLPPALRGVFKSVRGDLHSRLLERHATPHQGWGNCRYHTV
jgi:isocitrate dehydrogenase kinase/phosphatase